MFINGSISIGRPSGGSHGEYISIRLDDEASRVQFCEVRLRLEDFAKALTGQGHIPCEAELNGLSVVGKKKEREDARVELPDKLREALGISSYDRKGLGQLLATRPEYQKVGWKNETYLGSQSSISHGEGFTRLNFSRYRYVNPDVIQMTMFSGSTQNADTASTGKSD